MSDKVDLRLDWCSYEAAKFAVEHWHYSKALPAGKIVKIGVWENDYIGCVLFSRGANNNLLKPFDLEMTEGCELTRVALREHKNSVSKILSFSIKMLKKQSPNLRLIVSFADDRQKHLGVIYQATNWVYTGWVKSTPEYFLNGRWQHQRNVNSLLGSLYNLPPNTQKRDGGGDTDIYSL